LYSFLREQTVGLRCVGYSLFA